MMSTTACLVGAVDVTAATKQLCMVITCCPGILSHVAALAERNGEKRVPSTDRATHASIKCGLV